MLNESGPSQEAPKVVLTREQFDEIRNTPLTDMEPLAVRAFQAKIGPLGLGLHRGVVTIIVDGVEMQMETSMHDFGTIKSDGQETIPSGF